MGHFRQDPLIRMHLVENQGLFKHRYNGKEYIITEDTIDNLSDEAIQSLSTRLSKIYPQSKKPIKIPGGKGSSTKTKTPGTDSVTVKEIIQKTLIDRELKRLSLVEKLVEDKLHYPRVFKKLLYQPHLALEEKRLSPEDTRDLYLYVDESVGYNSKDNGFHHTMINVASKIKGIKVFSSQRLLFKEGYYWQHILKNVPKGKKILVFTQGCGGTIGLPPKGYEIHFCTHFDKGGNCGCNTIACHEQYKDMFHLHYGLDTPEKLKSLCIK